MVAHDVWGIARHLRGAKPWGECTSDNTYQAPPSQERANPPIRAARQRGKQASVGSS